MQTLIQQAKIVAILGAIFVLVIGIAQVFVELPTLNHLIFDTWWFRVVLVASLWVIAFLIVRFRAADQDD
jgi:hypothetical protein